MPDVLTNKSFKTDTRYSRYLGVPYYYHMVDKKYMSGMTSNLSTDTAYTIHTVKKPQETFDYLSYLYYNGNPTYYWVICDFNRERNPFRKLNVGEEIKIPVFSDIEFL